MAESPKQELAKVGDPLVSPFGEILDEEINDDGDSLPESELTVPKPPVAYKDYRPETRRVTSELKSTKDILNAAAIIFSYTLLGIPDQEIAENTGLTMEQIQRARETSTYADVFDTVMQELINANSAYIESRIAAYSGMALNTTATIAAQSRHTGYRLSAAKDLMDRGGLRPQDRGSNSNGMNELHIVITDSKDNETKIDLNMKGK